MEAALDILKAAAGRIGAEFSMPCPNLLEILIGVVVTCLFFLRGKAGVMDRLAPGQSDNILCQANHPHPLPGGEQFLLLFRDRRSKLTVNNLSDNIAVQEEAWRRAKVASLKNPIPPTTGPVRSEILINAFNHLAGPVGRAPRAQQQWLLAMTAKDRKLTGTECICCFSETLDRAVPG